MKKEKQNSFTLLIVIMSTIIVGVTIWAYGIKHLLYLDYFFNGKNYEFHTDKLGHFGDFIGGVLGTLLTVIATVYVYKTYISQKQELDEQRKLIIQQQFETTFFNLFNIHLELKKNLQINTNNSISVTSFPEVVSGIQFFEFVYEDFFNIWKYEHNLSPRPQIKDSEIKDKLDDPNFAGIFFSETASKEKLISDIQFKYDILFSHYSNYLGPYFRNLYHLLKYIDNFCPEGTDKKSYADILQSQMSFSESVLLFYNSFKFDKMRYQIKNFDFLENMHTSNLFQERHKDLTDLGKIKSN